MTLLLTVAKITEKWLIWSTSGEFQPFCTSLKLLQKMVFLENWKALSGQVKLTLKTFFQNRVQVHQRWTRFFFLKSARDIVVRHQNSRTRVTRGILFIKKVNKLRSQCFFCGSCKVSKGISRRFKDRQKPCQIKPCIMIQISSKTVYLYKISNLSEPSESYGVHGVLVLHNAIGLVLSRILLPIRINMKTQITSETCPKLFYRKGLLVAV